MSVNTRATHDPAMKINRREFLFYLGGASMALFSAGTCAVVFQVAQYHDPDFRTQPGVFELDPTILRHGPPPVPFPDARAWMILSETGLYALFADCQHRSSIPCTPQWVDVNNRFECPCYGSKFQLDGTYISGPASRGMDRFILHVETSNAILHTPEDGSPVPIDDATKIWVDTRTKIRGQPRE